MWCGTSMVMRKGKNVCSGTCRRRKHEMQKYLDAVYTNVKKMVKWEDEGIYKGMKRDVIKQGQNVEVFADWLGKRSTKKLE